MITLKKKIALVSAVIMAMSSVNVTMAAENGVLPVRLVAGENAVSVVFADSAAANSVKDSVSLEKKNGEKITVTTEVSGRTLNIVPSEKLLAHETGSESKQEYILTCGGDYSARFDIERVWSADLSDGAELSDSFYYLKGDQCTIEAGNNTLTIDEQNQKSKGDTVLFPKYSGQSTEENLTFNFNVKYRKPEKTTKSYPLTVSFNAQSTDKKTYDTTTGNVFNTSASWGKTAFVTDLTRGFVIATSDGGVSGGKHKKQSNWDADTGENKVSYTPANEESPEFTISVNKAGDVGTLFINGTAADVYDTAEFLEELSASESTALTDEQKAVLKDYEMPVTGYFAISQMPYNKTGICEYSDIYVTKSNVKRLVEADLVIVGDIAGDEEKLTLEFNEDITDVENTAEKVKVSCGGTEVGYNWEISGKCLVIKPEGGVVPNKDYTISISEGFGENKLTAKTELSADFRLNYQVGEITLESVSADGVNVYLTFGQDMTQVSNFKSCVKISQNGREIKYSPKVDGKSVTLELEELLVSDEIYDLDISKKLGYEAVKLGEDVHKYFMLKTFSAPDLSKLNTINAATGILEDFAGFATLTNGAATNGNDLASAIPKDGKLYVTKKSYSTLNINQMGLENYENYVLNFDLQHYGINDMVLMFNMTTSSTGGVGSIYAYAAANLSGFGWYSNSSKGKIHYRDFVSGSAKNAELINDSDIHVPPMNSVEEKVGGLPTVAEEDGVLNITLPEEDAPVYHYTLVKSGTKGTLYINNQLVDVYETAGEYDKYNKKYPEKTQIEATVPSKGFVVIGGNIGENSKRTDDYAYALSNISAASYTEYIGDKIEIVKKEEKLSADKKEAEGTVWVRNYFESAKNCKVVVSAYAKDNRLVGAQQIINKTFAGREMDYAGYKISADEEIVRVETALITPDGIVPQGAVSITQTKCVDYDEGVISLSGKTTDSEKEIYIALSNDQNFGADFSKIDKGHWAKLDNIGENGEFTYKFKYTDNGADAYTMGVYVLECQSGKIAAAKLSEYSFASKNTCDTFMSSVTGYKVKFEDLKKCAQTIGADVSYADNENKQTILVNAIYAEKEKMTSRAAVTSIVERERARMEFFLKLKNETSTAADVNGLIRDYKLSAALATSEYDALDDTNKVYVATKFIRADYETRGYAEFTKDLAAEASAYAGGGGGGSVGGGSSPSYAGGSGTTSVISNEMNNMLTAQTANQNADTGFGDLETCAWAEEAIDYLSKRKIVNGVGENTFAPQDLVTREQFVKMAVLAFDLYNDSAETDMNDVDVNSWAYRYVASAVENNIITGNGDNCFGMGRNITRQDMAVILYRISQLKGRTYSGVPCSFTDADSISDYAKEAVSTMSAAGILNGFEDATFRPMANATRAQAAKVIYEMLKEMN